MTVTSLPTLHAVHGCAADFLVWRDPSRGAFVAVVAKIAFALAPGETASLLPPVELVPSERHRDRSTTREIEAASDAVPFLPRPEILVVGHAYVPAGRSAASAVVHVSLGREAVTFRKTLHVYGDRETAASTPAPFRRMPLSWERAVRGEANPVGVDPKVGTPNLVDPQDATRPAGLGPVAAIWPPRQMRRHGAGRNDLESEPLVLPAGFDGSFFLAAPPDQWLDQLSGDEWISLDGLHPQLPRVQSRLPGFRVGARFEGPRGGTTVELRPDRVVIDSDRQRGTLTYRGSLAVDPAELGALGIFVGLAAPGQPVAWPDRTDPATRREHVLLRRGSAPAPLATPIASLGDTATLDDGRRAFPEAPPLAPPPAPAPSGVPRVHDDDGDDDDGSTRVADAASLLAARAPLPFGAPIPPPPPPPARPATPLPPQPIAPDVPVAPVAPPAPVAAETRTALPGLALPPPSPVQKTHIDDDDTAAPTGMVDMAALLASPTPFGPGGPNLAGLVPPAALAQTAAATPPPPPPPRDQLETLAVLDASETADIPAETLRQLATGASPAAPFAAPHGAAEIGAPPPLVAPPPIVEPAPVVEPPPPPPLVEPPPLVASPPIAPSAGPPAPTPPPVAPPSGAPHPVASAGSTPPAAPPLVASPPIAPRISVVPASAIVDDETTFEASGAHPAEALPFVGAPHAPRASAGSGGLPFIAPPTVGAPPPAPLVDDEPIPGEPRGDAVRTIADGPFLVATIPWQIHPPKDVLVVVVKASFDLVDGSPAAFRPEPELPSGDLFKEDEPTGALLGASDFAVLKPHCDVLFRGHAIAPGGSSTAMQVVLKVKGAHGRVDKTLHVFGDRTWQRAVISVAPSDPAPFEKMPVTWERAFGGPELAANPHGVGHRGRPAADGAARLPNFEAPGQQIKSPDDTPQPAGLTAIHPLNKARWGLLGTYDKAWFKERWPYFPKDFDFTYFQAAPPNQRLDKAVGDEEYELQGLVAGHPKIKGRLPAVKVRAFAKKTEAAGGKLVEIPMKLDTITFFGDDARVDLVWRGHIEVSDDDAPELHRIFATSEPVGGPALLAAEIRARYEKAMAPDEPPAEVPPASPEPEPEEEAPDAEAAELDAALAENEARLLRDLEAHGVDTARPSGPAASASPREVLAALRESGASEADIAEVAAALDDPVVGAEPRPPVVDLRTLVQSRVKAAEPLASLDLRGADLRDLDLAGQCFDGSDLRGARLERARLEGASFAEAILVRADLTDARCNGAVMTGADLTEATLDGAIFEGARLEGAALARIKAEKTVFRGVDATGARWVRARLPKARFDGATLTQADFSRAVLDDAVFDGAILDKSRLYDARANGASFADCSMKNVRAEGAVLTGSSFARATADDSIWERADLTSSTFQGASLVAASLVRATCLKTIFNEADLSNARLRKSKMNGAMFVKANLFEANLERADLELCDLRGSNLHAAVIVKTHLAHAKLDHAITSYSALGRKQP